MAKCEGRISTLSDYTLTPAEYTFIRQAINLLKAKGRESSKAKTESGSDIDGWHDEQFKIHLNEEAGYRRRMMDLEEILLNADIIEPVEQSEIVALGNGVLIKYEDGFEDSLIVVGYAINNFDNVISFNSPIGQAIMGAKRGAEITYHIDNRSIEIEVIDIYPPSVAKKHFAL